LGKKKKTGKSPRGKGLISERWVFSASMTGVFPKKEGKESRKFRGKKGKKRPKKKKSRAVRQEAVHLHKVPNLLKGPKGGGLDRETIRRETVCQKNRYERVSGTACSPPLKGDYRELQEEGEEKLPGRENTLI